MDQVWRPQIEWKGEISRMTWVDVTLTHWNAPKQVDYSSINIPLMKSQNKLSVSNVLLEW